MKKSKRRFHDPRKSEQTSQLSILKRYLRPILEYDEIPKDGTYYLKNDAQDNHWIYTQIKILGFRGNEFFATFIEEGISRPLSYEELQRTFIFDPRNEQEDNIEIPEGTFYDIDKDDEAYNINNDLI